MDIPRTYTQEEKMHLLTNLDIEVTHRTHQFESWLSDRLENFNMHQEGQVSRIPKQVRGMTMREFGDKYNGDIQAALRGFQKERLETVGGTGTLGELDKDARKRKWAASQETIGDERDHEPKAPKNARLAALASPKKVAGSSTGPGTAQRARLVANGNKTPSKTRSMGRVAPSPSPQKPKPPFGSNMGSFTHSSRLPSRPTSPAKPTGPRQPGSRVPSSTTFNPELPPKTPRFPSGVQAPSIPTTLRLPRRDESMLSINGSPLANPYQFDIGWFGGGLDVPTDAEDSQPGSQSLKRVKSNILIRRDASVLVPSNSNGSADSQTDSQVSNHTEPSESQSSSSTHSHENSQLHSHSQPHPVQSQPGHATQLPSSHSQPMSGTSHINPLTPRHRRTHTRSFSALVAIPTKDGHLLEFDPLQTSPRALDALEGISDSAKKQARAEMGRLVQAAVDKWKVG